ncbi:MAG: PAS domain-containing protein [Planctomycetota bacterium]
MKRPTPTGNERFFEEHELIVSKTDLKGRIAYSNRVFQAISGYTEAELIGAPHSILRHPSMPRCVFRLLWDRISSGREVFAYVMNLCKNGDHYWALAHVTPTLNASGRIAGYHSNRRVPSRESLGTIEPLYRELLAVEGGQRSRNDQCVASMGALDSKLETLGVSYDEFVFSLCAPREREVKAA